MPPRFGAVGAPLPPPDPAHPTRAKTAIKAANPRMRRVAQAPGEHRGMGLFLSEIALRFLIIPSRAAKRRPLTAGVQNCNRRSICRSVL
jgi:hypothetical protein